ncbi:insulinase family protein [Geodermatophilus sp. YIM 151500]|uniref:M16 family metallopeptidase n=1 Tax=Geodermatophilus sp. YIM 151500 TaxID=2984531 RepID=UPI0021E4EC01|nr:pitrilysin family protein [Geodermatophilus sp. YIM 151500]MCV2488658.1 insulinase family protein [Geodermatophilus sp. YIM 151500]
MSAAQLDLSLIPPLGEPRPQPVPEVAETTLANGLRVVVVPRPGVPLVELRLRVPFAAASAGEAAEHTARAMVLSGAMLLGTADRDQAGIAELLQSHGAELSIASDPDRLLFGTTLLPGGLAPVLGLLSELLTGAAYPEHPVEGERDRTAERIAIARSQPAVIARTALAARRYGDHPYAVPLPPAELVAEVDAPALRRLHAERVLPAGSSLVLVGELDPRAATDAVAAALEPWSASGRAVEAPPAAERRAATLQLVDRPGAVQSNLRLGGPAPQRTDPELAAVRLANMIYGGYFSSRLVENIRERRGYSYSPRSTVDHQAAASSFLVDADVATEVTAPALLEAWYELGRMALAPVTAAELDGARRYVLGSMALTTATHAGLASTLAALVGAGLPADWLAEHQQALSAVTVDDVGAAAQRYLAPGALTAVAVGDAERVSAPLEALGAVEVGVAEVDAHPGAGGGA